MNDGDMQTYYGFLLRDIVDNPSISYHTWHCLSAAFFVVYGKGLYSKHMQDFAVNNGIVFG